jgi:hypothetical protein
MTNLTALIDAFADLKARTAALKKEEDALKAALAELPRGAYESDQFRLNVIECEVETIDWKAIAARLEPSRQLVAAHTSSREQRSYRVGLATGKNLAA